MHRFKKMCFDEEGLITLPLLRWMERRRGAVLLETSKQDRSNHRTYLFLKPRSIITAYHLDEVIGSLRRVQELVARGFYLAGFVSYEAGGSFESAVRTDRLPQHPLVWFGVYDAPLVFNHTDRRLEDRSGLLKGISLSKHSPATLNMTDRLELKPSISPEEYAKRFRRIQEYILEGDTYQVNFTFKVRFEWKASIAELYARLRGAQRVPYAAWVHTGTVHLLSLSPELFFHKSKNRLTLKPMKGTAPRGRMTKEDRYFRETLLASEKDRAENLMIVDMLRNDAGRIAKIGTVCVTRFFDVERYETVHQATSTIRAQLRADVTIPDLFRCLFPSGSVTGAPKIRTMQIINELETEPRGVYTGAIGFFSPDGSARFNVAIRTITIASQRKHAEMGVGSGVVADSKMQSEYDECLLKANFLNRQPVEFELFETIRWDGPRKWYLLPFHLRRLADSASYFGFPFSRITVLRELRAYERDVLRKKRWFPARVKLMLDRRGKVRLECAHLEPMNECLKVAFWTERTNSSDRFYFHKTTHRPLYDTALTAAMREGLFDVLFENERGEVTEGARTNLIVRQGEQFFTPAIESGVLAGTYRSSLLQRGWKGLEEKVLYRDDVISADEVYVCNALRGLVKVEIQSMSL